MGGKALLRRFSNMALGPRWVLQHDIQGERQYPFGPDSRFGPDDIPPIMMYTLTHVSDDPEALWDELVPAVRSRRRDTLAVHYR